MPACSSGIQLATLLLATVILAACAGEPPRSAPAVAQPAPPAVGSRSQGGVSRRAAQVAVKQVGVPYRYGGHGESGFDCSGLVHFAYSRAGKSLPRTTHGLWRELEPVPSRDLRVGDVLFFDIEGKVSHVGLYLGASRFVHAPSSGREVSIASLDSDFYRSAFVRGGRPR